MILKRKMQKLKMLIKKDEELYLKGIRVFDSHHFSSKFNTFSLTIINVSEITLTPLMN